MVCQYCFRLTCTCLKRGKIFRILLALLESQAPDQLWGDTLQEWWNMYSRIQYVQFVPFSSESLFPSREVSPQL